MNLPDRLLHHSIDAATYKAAPSRRRRKSLAADVLLTLATIAMIVITVYGAFQ